MSMCRWQNMNVVIVGITMLAMLAGCGTDTKTNTNTVYITTTIPDSTYLVEYIPGAALTNSMAAAAEGKSTFTLRVRNRASFAAASGLSLSIYPMMHMGSTSHSAPVDSVKDNGDGTYDCAIYYLMPSGAGMGYWDLQVKIGSETTTFYPSVDMHMITDTWKTTLKGQSDDLISNMSGSTVMSTKRTYYLFSDGTASTSQIDLFLAAQGNMMTSYPALFTGATLTNAQNTSWTASSVLVEAATDTVSSWHTGTNPAGDGHWTVSGLSLTSAQTNTVYVRMTVNGMLKTTDGLVSNSSLTNTYATFTVTP